MKTHRFQKLTTRFGKPPLSESSIWQATQRKLFNEGWFDQMEMLHI